MRKFVRYVRGRIDAGLMSLLLTWQCMPWQADRRLIGLTAYFLHANAQKLLTMSVMLLLAAALTIYEAEYRHSTPATWHTAVFYSAPLLLFSGLVGGGFAVFMGVVVGLMAGIFCRDNGAWFTYLAPNVAEACTVWGLARWARISLSTPMTTRMLWKLAGICLVAISVGASIGAFAIIATNAVWSETTLPWSFTQLMLHWLVGDAVAAAWVWAMFMTCAMSNRRVQTS